MRSSILGAVSSSAAMLAAALILSNTAMAQAPAEESDWSSKTKPKTFPIYDPYPPGILPADLSSELARVLREVDVIEARALAEWRALPPPVLTGQPRDRASSA